jgi:tetratricopeptide (TPR) repeat protein
MVSTALLPAIFLFQSVEMQAVCDAARSMSFAKEARREVANQHFDLAAATFDDALNACPEKRELLVEKAHALLMGRRFADARSVSDGILRVDARNAAALKIKGNVQYLLGEIEQSIGTLITLLEHHPEDYEGAYMLGRIYYQEGRIDQAIGQFERALRLNPLFYRAWDNLGLCWQAQAENDKAIAHFLQAIKIVEKDHPDYDWAYANLADLLIQTGEFESAFSAASKAANRNPQSSRNFYIGAKALDKLGKTELCLNWLERSAALDPSYSEAQYMLSRVYRRIGQPEKAQQARNRFLDLKAKEPAKRR